MKIDIGELYREKDEGEKRNKDKTMPDRYRGINEYKLANDIQKRQHWQTVQKWMRMKTK